MDSSERQASRDELTPQEAAFMSDRRMAYEALDAGRFHTPNGIVVGKSIEEVNAKRRDENKGYFGSQLAYDVVDPGKFRELREQGVGLALSFEPLDPVTGETVRDPRIVRVDRQSKKLIGPDEELTQKFHDFMLEREEQEREIRQKGEGDINSKTWSYFLRESPTRGEKETPEPPEGMRNV